MGKSNTDGHFHIQNIEIIKIDILKKHYNVSVIIKLYNTII